MTEPTALFTDFDGTISEDDFFWYVADSYFDKSALEPWNKYLRGELTHLEAMNAIFSQIRLPETELLAFIDTIRIDPEFAATAELCRHKGIPVYIASAGCDYYINRLLGSVIAANNIRLVTNHGVYSPHTGLVMHPPADSPFYDPEVGISKAKVVDLLHDQGYRVVMAGDGPPDFPAAEKADEVFAKKILLEKCLQANIKTRTFNTFKDVYNFLCEV